jgi:adenosylhomocysteine nucleosidase
MKDIVILVALEDELPKDSFKEFRIEYTGVGKINACFKTIEVINAYSPKLIINYGTAGTLKSKLNGLYKISDFFQRDMDASELGFKVGETPFDNISNISFGNDGLSIGTGDNFVSQHPKILTDLVDMEAYAIAKVCLLKKINFLCFKYISDNADKDASNNWEKNISSGKIAFQKKMQEINKDLIENYL